MAVDGDEIRPAIVTKIHKSRAPLDIRQRGQRNAGIVRHVRKAERTVVTVQRVELIGEVGDINGKLAGVVIVRDCDPHRPLLGPIAANRRPGLQAQLLKLSLAQVAIEIVGRGVIRYENVG